MTKGRKLAVGAVAATAALALGTGVGIAASSGDDEPLRGSARDRAVEAALEHVGGGTVVETEVGDDGAAYSVEIRLDGVRVVEVNLDAAFNVIGDEPDDGEESEGSPGDD
ncbi:MAG TPA: hypothetical protein VF129_11115 [Actinomycetota bacterium]